MGVSCSKAGAAGEWAVVGGLGVHEVSALPGACVGTTTQRAQ